MTNLSEEQRNQVSAIINRAREISYKSALLYQYPEEWENTIRTIQETAAAILSEVTPPIKHRAKRGSGFGAVA